MSYSLSFANDFYYSEEDYGNWDILETDQPTNCMDALIHYYLYQRKEFLEMLTKVFNADLAHHVKVIGSYTSMVHELLDKIKETNTCSNLSNPVEVWIDSDGDYTIFVY